MARPLYIILFVQSGICQLESIVSGPQGTLIVLLLCETTHPMYSITAVTPIDVCHSKKFSKL